MAKTCDKVTADTEALLLAATPPQDLATIDAILGRSDYGDLVVLLGAVLGRYSDLLVETHKMPAGLRRRPPGED